MLLFFDLWFWILFDGGSKSATAKRSAAQLPSVPTTTQTIPQRLKIKKSAPIRTPRNTGQSPDPDPRSKKIKTHLKKTTSQKHFGFYLMEETRIRLGASPRWPVVRIGADFLFCRDTIDYFLNSSECEPRRNNAIVLFTSSYHTNRKSPSI